MGLKAVYKARTDVNDTDALKASINTAIEDPTLNPLQLVNTIVADIESATVPDPATSPGVNATVPDPATSPEVNATVPDPATSPEGNATVPDPATSPEVNGTVPPGDGNGTVPAGR